jgi:hypothetical protein
MDGEASRLIEEFGLTAHPEGGHYREFFRSTIALSTPRGTRSASTAIWFLLPAGEFSAFHQVLGIRLAGSARADLDRARRGRPRLCFGGNRLRRARRAHPGAQGECGVRGPARRSALPPHLEVQDLE